MLPLPLLLRAPALSLCSLRSYARAVTVDVCCFPCNGSAVALVGKVVLYHFGWIFLVHRWISSLRFVIALSQPPHPRARLRRRRRPPLERGAGQDEDVEGSLGHWPLNTRAYEPTTVHARTHLLFVASYSFIHRFTHTPSHTFLDLSSARVLSGRCLPRRSLHTDPPHTRSPHRSPSPTPLPPPSPTLSHTSSLNEPLPTAFTSRSPSPLPSSTMRVATYLATTLSLAAFAAATSSSGSVRRDTECTTCDAVTEVTTQACSDGDLEQCATYLCTVSTKNRDGTAVVVAVVVVK